MGFLMGTENLFGSIMPSIVRLLLFELSDLQDLERLGWPSLRVEENQLVTESLYHGPKLAVGGSATMIKKQIELGAQGPVGPG